MYVLRIWVKFQKFPNFESIHRKVCILRGVKNWRSMISYSHDFLALNETGHSTLQEWSTRPAFCLILLWTFTPNGIVKFDTKCVYYNSMEVSKMGRVKKLTAFKIVKIFKLKIIACNWLKVCSKLKHGSYLKKVAHMSNFITLGTFY